MSLNHTDLLSALQHPHADTWDNHAISEGIQRDFPELAVHELQDDDDFNILRAFWITKAHYIRWLDDHFQRANALLWFVDARSFIERRLASVQGAQADIEIREALQRFGRLLERLHELFCLVESGLVDTRALDVRETLIAAIMCDSNASGSGSGEDWKEWLTDEEMNSFEEKFGNGAWDNISTMVKPSNGIPSGQKNGFVPGYKTAFFKPGKATPFHKSAQNSTSMDVPSTASVAEFSDLNQDQGVMYCSSSDPLKQFTPGFSTTFLDSGGATYFANSGNLVGMAFQLGPHQDYEVMYASHSGQQNHAAPKPSTTFLNSGGANPGGTPSKIQMAKFLSSHKGHSFLHNNHDPKKNISQNGHPADLPGWNMPIMSQAEPYIPLDPSTRFGGFDHPTNAFAQSGTYLDPLRPLYPITASTINMPSVNPPIHLQAHLRQHGQLTPAILHHPFAQGSQPNGPQHTVAGFDTNDTLPKTTTKKRTRASTTAGRPKKRSCTPSSSEGFTSDVSKASSTGSSKSHTRRPRARSANAGSSASPPPKGARRRLKRAGSPPIDLRTYVLPPTPPESAAAVRNIKKNKTSYEPWLENYLTQIFFDLEGGQLSGELRARVVQVTGLTSRRLTYWFSNHRIRFEPIIALFKEAKRQNPDEVRDWISYMLWSQRQGADVLGQLGRGEESYEEEGDEELEYRQENEEEWTD
ncbi:hypothetical protein BC936DRAFT_148403 [Jimgerdemannia flammicorona]|uniref:Homeobox domain-containing protein n=1 Tax=Jimgerdemannia flammicorona TaxID=994334 RepID=A0A433D351_9FUNG|nr:hypothetical protein BC936DRAFT_148403 [Jimgerdemannia flammicorona]